MSSIPLPRILQAKKTNGELEKEQFDKQMVRFVQLQFGINWVIVHRLSNKSYQRVARLITPALDCIYQIFWLLKSCCRERLGVRALPLV